MPPGTARPHGADFRHRRRLTGVSEDLQEISRGIHPAILSRGGLGPALKTLARRSTVPVVLHFGLDQRLPEAADVAAYYVVSEAITNTAKHAQASEVNVSVGADRGTCCSRFETTELGEPTAPRLRTHRPPRPRRGARRSGGHMEIESLAGSGTALMVKIPLEIE